MNVQQKRIIKVLERIIDQCDQDEDDAGLYSELLEDVLNDLHSHDFFGSEGQSDPRGDGRNGEWSMYRVEGIDK